MRPPRKALSHLLWVNGSQWSLEREGLNLLACWRWALSKLEHFPPLGHRRYLGWITLVWVLSWHITESVAMSLASTRPMLVAPSPAVVNKHISRHQQMCLLERQGLVENQYIRRMLSSSATFSRAEELGSVSLGTRKEDISSLPRGQTHLLHVQGCDSPTTAHMKSLWGEFFFNSQCPSSDQLCQNIWGWGLGISNFLLLLKYSWFIGLVKRLVWVFP